MNQINTPHPDIVADAEYVAGLMDNASIYYGAEGRTAVVIVPGRGVPEDYLVHVTLIDGVTLIESAHVDGEGWSTGWAC